MADVKITIYVGAPTENLVNAMSKKDKMKYYGTTIPVVYEVTGLDAKATYKFARTKKEKTTDKNGVDVNDKVPGPDGPNPNFPYTQKTTAKNGTITYINFDAPTFAVVKPLLPATKTVDYVFTVYDNKQKVVAQNSITLTWTIDANGKTTVGPMADSIIMLNKDGTIVYKKK